MNHQTIIVLDFGGQYNQLIARRVRECGVYCEVKPYTTPLADLLAMKPIGFIFTGGPNSVYLEDAPHVDPALFDAGVPVLGICYGCQLIAHHLGGKVVAANDATAREYGKTETFFDTNCKLFKGLPEKSVTWMSHGDYMEKVPEGFSLVAHSDACPNVAICDETRGFYGVQHHPEVNHTEFGTAMIRNFLYEVCGATGDWTMGDYKNTAIAAVREKVGSGRVLLALSGGVDSSVVAALLAEAVGPQLTCVFVDHGLMRLNEGDEVEAAFKKWDINFVRVNAEGRFLSKLAGISDPERKRKIIGEEFIRVFEEESKKIGAVDFLAQGTIYPDVIESGLGNAAVIKSHHNVGGLPDYVDFKEIIEPLRLLFKDEVRQLGRELGLPEYLVSPPAVPRPGPCHPHHGRDHEGKGRHAAPCRRDLPRGAGKGRRKQEDEPVLRRPDRHAHRRRHGRWPQLRPRACAARCDDRGLHDRRLGPHPLRAARQDQRPHRQRGQGHQQNCLRHHQQAPSNGGVGINRKS